MCWTTTRNCKTAEHAAPVKAYGSKLLHIGTPDVSWPCSDIFFFLHTHWPILMLFKGHRPDFIPEVYDKYIVHVLGWRLEYNFKGETPFFQQDNQQMLNLSIICERFCGHTDLLADNSFHLTSR